MIAILLAEFKQNVPQIIITTNFKKIQCSYYQFISSFFNICVQVDGFERSLPVEDGGLSVIISGRFVLLRAVCGLNVAFEGTNAVVYARPKFKKHMTGTK